jgi:hypothetical protein
VVRQNQVRAVAERETRAEIAVAAPLELVDFAEQHVRVDDHALAEHAQRAGAQDAAREQAHDELVVADDQRMPGVGAAGVTHDDLRELRINVDDFPLSLVTPLRTNDRYDRHRSL